MKYPTNTPNLLYPVYFSSYIVDNIDLGVHTVVYLIKCQKSDGFRYKLRILGDTVTLSF